MTPAPINPDERESWRQDPVAHEAISALHDAYDELREALDDRVNATGLLLRGGNPSARLAGARERLEAAERAWATELASVDELLRRRQKGGE